MTDSLIPPSITGKGSGFPPGGSVLDHAFGTSDPYTLGVEEEYMLLDSETFDLVQHIDTVLAFGSSGLRFFDGQLVGKIASSVVIGIPLVVLGRRFLPAKAGDMVVT